MSCRAYSGSAVHVDAYVAALRRDWLPGVKTNSDFDRRRVGMDQRHPALRVDGGNEGVPGSRECNKELFSARVDLGSAMGGEYAAKVLPEAN